MKINKQSWDEYFLDLVKKVRTRSIDPSTKHGCYIVDSNHRVVSQGYNGPVQGIPDEIVELTRPEKYRYMIHSEQNAVVFAQQSLIGCTAYITGHPCTTCFNLLVQAGVSSIKYGNQNSQCVSKEDKDYCLKIAKSKGVQLIQIEND